MGGTVAAAGGTGGVVAVGWAAGATGTSVAVSVGELSRAGSVGDGLTIAVLVANGCGSAAVGDAADLGVAVTSVIVGVIDALSAPSATFDGAGFSPGVQATNPARMRIAGHGVLMLPAFKGKRDRFEVQHEPFGPERWRY